MRVAIRGKLRHNHRASPQPRSVTVRALALTQPIALPLLTCALVALAWPATARAQDADAQRKAEAKQLYQKGAQALLAGDHGAALFHLKAGQKLDPNGMFPYTIAIAYGRMGKYDEAIQNARQALSFSDLPQDTRAKTEARLRVYLTARRSQALAASLAERQQPDPITTPRPAPRKGLSGLGWAGIGATVVGAGLVTGAVITNTQVNDRLEDDGITVKPGATVDEVEALQQRGLIMLGAGGVLAVTGVILLVVDVASGPSATPEPRAVTPTLGVAPGGAQVGVSIRF